MKTLLRLFGLAFALACLHSVSCAQGIGVLQSDIASKVSTGVANGVYNPAICAVGITPTWCAGSDLGAWINAASAAIAASSAPGHILVPPGSYTLTTEIHPLSNIDYEGSAGTTITTGSGYAARIFHAIGTSGAPITNIRIHGFKLSNGTATATTVNSTNDLIRLEYCNNCEIDHNVGLGTSGRYGLAVVNSNHISGHDNSWSNIGYAAMIALINSGGTTSDVSFFRNYVNGIVNNGTTGLGQQGYGLASGSEDSTVPSPSNISLIRYEDNNVNNVLNWECYDLHGGAHMVITGNHCTNSYFGGQFGSVAGGGLTDVYIGHNWFSRGTGLANGYGIVLGGYGNLSPVVDATIDDNHVDGYGYSSSVGGQAASVGAITLIATQNTKVINNKIPTYYQGAIVLYGDNLSPQITGNWSGDVISSNVPGASSQILFASPGSWGVWIDGNISQPSSIATTPIALVYNASEGTEVNIGPNNQTLGPKTTTTTGSVVTTTLFSGGFFPANLSSLPGASTPNLIAYASGTVGYDPNYRPAYIFSPPASTPYQAGGGGGYYSLDTVATITTGNTVTGASACTISGLTGGLATTRPDEWLPPGMNISVAGAGAAGAALLTRVISNTGTSIVVDTCASTSVTAGVITYQAGSVYPIQQNQQEATQPWGTAANTLCNTGCQETSGYVNASARGFEYSSISPFLSLNAILNPGADSWSQSNVSNPSYLLDMDTVNGLQFFSAPAARASGTKAAFWAKYFNATATAIGYGTAGSQIAYTAAGVGHLYAPSLGGQVPNAALCPNGTPSSANPYCNLYTGTFDAGNGSTSGTTFGSQTANQVFAGPTSGAAAVPAFRPLVLADIPTVGTGTGAPCKSVAIPAGDAVIADSAGCPIDLGRAPAALGTAGQIYVVKPDGTSVVPVTMSGDCTITGAGVISCASSPKIVASIASTTYSGTTTLGPTTLYTTAAAGQYELCAQLSVKTAGTGSGTWSSQMSWTSDGNTNNVLMGSQVSNATAGSANIAISGGNIPNCIEVYVDTGTTISYYVTAIGTITTAPTLRYGYKVTYKGQ